MAALLLVAALAVTSNAVIWRSVSGQDESAAVINLAGRQRMLSQRTVLLLMRLALADEGADSAEAREELRAAVDLFATSHEALVNGSDELGITAELPSPVAALYAAGLDRQMRERIATLDALAEVPADALHQDLRFQNIVDAPEAELLAQLDRVVSLYEAEAHRQLALARKLEVILVIAALAAVAGVWWLLMRPMIRGTEELLADLHLRQRDMDTVLANTRDAIWLTRLDGGIELSSRVAREFGAGEHVADVVWRGSQADLARMGWEDLGEESMPAEVILGQLAARVEEDGRVWEVGLDPVRTEEGRISHVLVQAQDSTSDVLSAREAARSREASALLADYLEDPVSTELFVSEIEARIQRLGVSDRRGAARELHTIKGMAAVQGLERMSLLAHELEDLLAMEPDTPVSELQSRLARCWHAFLRHVGPRMTGGQEGVRVGVDEHRRLLTKLDGELRDEVEAWRWPRVATRLDRLGREATRVAENLGREVEVHVDDDGLRLPAAPYQSLWSELVHLVRNAVDHGVETPAARESAGKPSAGRVDLQAGSSDSWLWVRVRDDGAGIDFEAVGRRASEIGVELADDAAAVRWLLTDGASVREVATETSGRGVGLAAVAARVESMAGTFELEHTAPGVGTSWLLRVPLQTTEQPGAQSAWRSVRTADFAEVS